MPAEIFIDYIESHFHDAMKYLDDYYQDEQDEVLHELRLNLKKLKTCLECMQQIEQKEKVDYMMDHLKKVFKRSGKLRDSQLHLTWFKKNKLTQTIIFTGLEKKVEDHKSKLRKHIPYQEKKLKKKQKSLIKTAHGFDPEDIEAYYFNLRKNYRGLIQGGISTEHWHDLRKLTKKLMYAYAWLPKEKIDFLSKSISVESLDKLQTTIGLWHDEIVRKEWLGSQEIFLEDDPKLQIEFKKAWQRIKSTELSCAGKVRKLLNMEQQNMNGLLSA